MTDGLLVMLLMGLAIQIKYTVAIEGAYFGLALLWAGWRGGVGLARLAGCALFWIVLALLPTALVWAAYAAAGHQDEWLFCNFVSVGLRTPIPFAALMEELAGGLATTILLFIAAILGWWRRPRGNPAMVFAAGWVVAAIPALIAMHTFSPHYWIPLVPPLLLVAVPAFARMRRAALGLAVVAAVVGQGLIGYYIYSKGDARTVARMSAAMGPMPHCLFVFDGFPALYQETDSCLPSRFLFPNFLNGMMLVKALGVDPNAEVERIMATRPDAVVLDEPRWELQNPQTAAIVDRELAAHYTLVLSEPTGKGRWRLVYRVKPQDARH